MKGRGCNVSARLVDLDETFPASNWGWCRYVSEDDKYESTYRARYELRRTEDGGGVRAWKIVGGSVVY